MKEIHGEAKTIRELLSGTHYYIDYYQREYKWQTEQVKELLDDLTQKFLDDYKESDERDAVGGYGRYFLGSIILSEKENQTFVVDGQQRLTTLTLLLIYLYRNLSDPEDKAVLQDLIFARVHGTRSFNLDADERTSCMEALFKGDSYDSSSALESVKNIVARYQDIEQHFPTEVSEHALPYFADWLIENVNLVEIATYSDEDAYTIFETMNDRGLSLSPLDMLKGYLLSNITDERKRLEANRIWKDCITALADVGKGEDTNAFKAWLRSQYANSIRERKKNAQPQDFDRLGTEFHRWVREHEKGLGLKVSNDFANFIEREMQFYTSQYKRLREVSNELTPRA